MLYFHNLFNKSNIKSIKEWMKFKDSNSLKCFLKDLNLKYLPGDRVWEEDYLNSLGTFTNYGLFHTTEQDDDLLISSLPNLFITLSFRLKTKEEKEKLYYLLQGLIKDEINMNKIFAFDCQFELKDDIIDLLKFTKTITNIINKKIKHRKICYTEFVVNNINTMLLVMWHAMIQEQMLSLYKKFTNKKKDKMINKSFWSIRKIENIWFSDERNVKKCLDIEFDKTIKEIKEYFFNNLNDDIKQLSSIILNDAVKANKKRCNYLHKRTKFIKKSEIDFELIDLVYYMIILSLFIAYVDSTK